MPVSQRDVMLGGMALGLGVTAGMLASQAFSGGATREKKKVTFGATQRRDVDLSKWVANDGGAPEEVDEDHEVQALLLGLAKEKGLDVAGGKMRVTSSRFCLGVEHGDYNGTDLLGVGTDRFIWLMYKPRPGSKQVRIYSHNLPDEGVVTFDYGKVEPPKDSDVVHSWGRFPKGAAYVLDEVQKMDLTVGFDAILFGNIPGGGMSRSASLSINLICTMLDVHGFVRTEKEGWTCPASAGGKNGGMVIEHMGVVELAKAIENVYIGSPCGNLDQIMIYFAKEGHATHFSPATKAVRYLKYPKLSPNGTPDFQIVALDTGTDRPGLDKSTYAIRAHECEEFSHELVTAGLLKEREADGRGWLADVKDLAAVKAKFGATHGDKMERLEYILDASRRFKAMMTAWKDGNIEAVGALFREDGHGLRDKFKISGPELEAMCDIARTVDGVLGERMLGGGDKGAAGAIVWAKPTPGTLGRTPADVLKARVAAAYPKSYPAMESKYAVHAVKMCQGMHVVQL